MKKTVFSAFVGASHRSLASSWRPMDGVGEWQNCLCWWSRSERHEAVTHENAGRTYYNVPFNDGAFSCSWKLEEKNYLVLVFDGKGNGKATVVIDGRTFTVSSDKLRQPIEKFGVAHTWGTLHTKDVKIDKTK
jgi:hypothetical protein